jgi:non-canonical (house-cleaning) NTP pyrophosphatase
MASSESAFFTLDLPVRVCDLIKAGKELGEADVKCFSRQTASRQAEQWDYCHTGLKVVTRGACFEQAVVLAIAFIPFVNSGLF